MFRQPGPDGPSDRSCPRSHLGARRSRASSFGAAPDPSHGGGTIGFLRRLFGLGKKAEEPPVEARFGADELARRLDVSLADLAGFRPEYRTFSIRKKGGGHRKIAAPDDRTKELQRRIDRRLLARLRPHDCATGFRRGFSVVMNALPHAGRPVVVRMDLVDFFGTTRADRIERWLLRLGWDAEATEILVRLTTLSGGLPQGAPTSPRLANLVNYRLDARLDGLARAGGTPGVYTRYADDLTFSFAEDRPGQVGPLIQYVKKIVAEHGYRLHIRKKLRIRRSHQRQVVTGLVVNERPNLPRSVRRRLRAVEHHLATGREATLTEGQLAGWKAFASMVERQRRMGE